MVAVLFTFVAAFVALCNHKLHYMAFSIVIGDSLKHAWNPFCHGIIYGVIGKIQMLPGKNV